MGQSRWAPAHPVVGRKEVRALGRGCLFWIVVSVVLSVGLTVLANLILNLF